MKDKHSPMPQAGMGLWLFGTHQLLRYKQGKGYGAEGRG